MFDKKTDEPSLDYKRVVIFGSYNQQSVGDKAILISLIDLLFRVWAKPLRIKVICFDVPAIKKEIEQYQWAQFISLTAALPPSRAKGTFTSSGSGRVSRILRIPNRFRVWMSILRFALKSPNNLMSDADLLVIGGGNLFMDLFPNWPIRPFMVANQFKRCNVPIVIAGVGAFPVNTRLGNLLLKSVARSATKTFVRDGETFRLFDSWCVPSKVHPDFAFSLPLVDRPAETVYEPLAIAVNIAPVYGPNWPYTDTQRYVDYLDSMADSLCAYFQNQNDDSYFLFIDTNYPTDREGTTELIKRLVKRGVEPSRIKYPDRLQSTQDIVREFKRAKVAVVTRLHAGIMSLVAECPVIAIAYQPKVRDVFKNIGLGSNVININALDELEMHLSCFDYTVDKYVLPRDSLAKLDEMNKSVIREALACTS